MAYVSTPIWSKRHVIDTAWPVEESERILILCLFESGRFCCCLKKAALFVVRGLASSRFTGFEIHSLRDSLARESLHAAGAAAEVPISSEVWTSSAR